MGQGLSTLIDIVWMNVAILDGARERQRPDSFTAPSRMAVLYSIQRFHNGKTFKQRDQLEEESTDQPEP